MLNRLIKFEPINVTQIVITLSLATIIIFVFRSHFDSFFDTLKDRPIKVTISGSETKIELDAPVESQILVESVSTPNSDSNQIREWESQIKDISSVEELRKLGFIDLYNKISNFNTNNIAVLNYSVHDRSQNFFDDAAMLTYLAIASEKVDYLAFYDNEVFVASIAINDVISGLASQNRDFKFFGEKLKSGGWENFPGLIKRDVCFESMPTVRELHSKLKSIGIKQIPLIKDNRLSSFLSYKSIADNLYNQL